MHTPVHKWSLIVEKCFHYSKVGYWKYNYPISFIIVRKTPTGLCLTDIDISITYDANIYWVWNTACPSHIYNMLQGLRMTRMQQFVEVMLRIINGDFLQVQVVGQLNLLLVCNTIVVLHNKYDVLLAKCQLINGYYIQLKISEDRNS